jgi:hypothetical protein
VREGRVYRAWIPKVTVLGIVSCGGLLISALDNAKGWLCGDTV